MNMLSTINEAHGSLKLYEAACSAIAEAKSVDELKTIRDQSEAMRAAARIAKNKQAEVDMAEIRFRAERALGEMMAAQREAGLLNTGTAGMGRPEIGGLEGNPPKKDDAPTLAESGIDKNLADRARKFAAIPEQEFNGIVSAWRSVGCHIYSTGQCTSSLPPRTFAARPIAQ